MSKNETIKYEDNIPIANLDIRVIDSENRNINVPVISSTHNVNTVGFNNNGICYAIEDHDHEGIKKSSYPHVGLGLHGHQHYQHINNRVGI